MERSHCKRERMEGSYCSEFSLDSGRGGKVEPGGRKSLGRKETLACDTDKKERRAHMDAGELQDKEPWVEKWEDVTALGEPRCEHLLRRGAGEKVKGFL